MRTCKKIDCNNKHKNIKYDLCNSCLGRTECREKGCKKFVDVPYQWCFHHKKKFTNYLEKGYAFIDDDIKVSGFVMSNNIPPIKMAESDRHYLKEKGSCYDGKECEFDEFEHCITCCECKECVKSD